MLQVLISGGSGGIGGQVVKILADRGIKVVVLDVMPLTFTASSNVYYYKCDVTSPEVIATVAASIRKNIGEPTVLISSADVCRGKAILDATEAEIRFTFEVNTLAHYWIAKEFVPSIATNNHGVIVTVASLAAFVAAPNMVDYSSSKAPAQNFHQGLTAELKIRYNAPKVRTICINPGYTKTLLFEGFKNDHSFVFPAMEVDIVAEAIVDKMMAGYSGQVMIPGLGWILTSFRSTPHWLQNTMITKGADAMSNWKGRQVIDVEKWRPRDASLKGVRGKSE